MEFTQAQIRAFRYWIQGYANFYEPMVMEYFKLSGYRVLRRPAIVDQLGIQRIIDALFDGNKLLGPQVDAKVFITTLKKRNRLQPDLLLEKNGSYYLAELKSWGGFNTTGQFDLQVATSEFIRNPTRALFFLVDNLEGHKITGKILVTSARSPKHVEVHMLLESAYQTSIELLYLDDIFRTPQLAGFIDKQMRYLDAAIAELKQALMGGTKDDNT